jgi:HEAT repeat protein
MSVEIDDWILQIRSADTMTFEDAYFGVRPEGPGVIARLIAELHASPDVYTRGKFCELLGEMGDESALAVLTTELEHPEEVVRQWASQAIQELKSEEARAAKAAHLGAFRTRQE